MSSFLTQVEGLTPVIDVVVKDVGLIPAAIYGVVWRYCQMESGICVASLDTIAERAGVSRKTVERHVKQLCDAGCLEDLTPEVKNRPHTYADTDKAKITGLVIIDAHLEGDTIHGNRPVPEKRAARIGLANWPIGQAAPVAPAPLPGERKVQPSWRSIQGRHHYEDAEDANDPSQHRDKWSVA